MMTISNEADLISARACAAGLSSPVGYHLMSRVTVLDYIRIADEITARVRPGAVLDWGCGFGQMSFLLQRRGLAVTSYDVAERTYSEPSTVFPEVFISRGIEPVKLPFPNDAFDAVISCGVLEHVPDESGSLQEIWRVLRGEGIFLIYNLPQQRSYKEFLLEKMRAGYTHERKYSATNIAALLRSMGFRVERIRRAGMLPHNLTPFPRLRGLYNWIASPVLRLDGWLASVPMLNQFAEALEVVASKESP